MRQRTGSWLAMTIAVALAACSSSKEVPVDPNIFPANYKQEILDTLSATLADPTNIRNAFVTDPALTTVDKDQRYAVCVRFTPRDAGRRYESSVDRIAYFYGGHLNQLVPATPEQCGKAPYKPFPELERLCKSEHKCV